MKIPEELLPVVEWWEKNGKRTVAVLILAGVCGIAYLAWQARKERAEAAAAEATSAVLQDWQSVIADPTSQAAEQALLQMKETVGAAGAGADAGVMKLLQATADFRRKNYAEALEVYEALAGSDELPELYKDIPVLGRAQCLEASGELAAAQEAFAAFAKASPESCLALTAQLGSARCLAQLGKKAEAVAALEQLLSEKRAAGAPSEIQSVQFTLDLVKRWIPASERPVAAAPAVEVPAVPEVPTAAEAAPAAESPAPAEAPSAVETAEVK